MGDALHYHGFGADCYGHRHPFLHIIHDHDELYDEQAELDATYCDRCGTHHSSSLDCEREP